MFKFQCGMFDVAPRAHTSEIRAEALRLEALRLDALGEVHGAMGANPKSEIAFQR